MPDYNPQFWASTPTEEFFVVKQKIGNQPMTKKDAVRIHIANGIYRLFGVRTPDLYIGNYQNTLSLISQVLPNYRDLADCLDSDDPFSEINQNQEVEDCVATYKSLEENLNIQNKEALLAAAILLEDSDVIGAGLRNIGLVKQGNIHQIVKIDPDEGIFHSLPTNLSEILNDFERKFSLNNPMFYQVFSLDVLCNNPDSILGNLHLREFFHDIDKKVLRETFAKFVSLSDNVIKQLIIRDEYIRILGQNNGRQFLEELSSVIIGKKAIIKKLIDEPVNSVQPLIRNPVFTDNIELSQPLEIIPHGASRPMKVKRIMPDEKDQKLGPIQISMT